MLSSLTPDTRILWWKRFCYQERINRQNNHLCQWGLTNNIDLQHRQSIKQVYCQTYGVSRYYLKGKRLKVNAPQYLAHLHKDLIPEIDKLDPNKEIFFTQISAPSHCAKIILSQVKKELNRWFVKSTEWTPSSPDWNSFNQFFWKKVQKKIYQGKLCHPLNSTAILQTLTRWKLHSRSIGQMRQ